MSKWDKLYNYFISNNLKIFPVQPNGKTPMIPRWQEDCSHDLRQILYWFEQVKNCNWGLPATQNGLFIIDLDVHDIEKNGLENFEKLMRTLGIDSINTMMQVTPSGGVHLIYQTNELLKTVPNCSNAFKRYSLVSAPPVIIHAVFFIEIPYFITDRNSATFCSISPLNTAVPATTTLTPASITSATLPR